MEIHNSLLEIEVTYALPQHQILKRLLVPVGTTVAQAIAISGVMKQFPDIDLKRNKIGIFSRFTGPEAILRNHDRIEIYRPLIVDPKETRRNRAAKKRSLKPKQS